MLTLVIALGILIAAGTITVAVTIIGRTAPKHATNVMLDQPPGTQIVGVAGVGGQLAVALHGGGGDRVVILDPASGRVVGAVTLKP